MISWSSKHIAHIVFFFVIALTGVITANTLCELEIIEYAPNLSHNYNHTSDTDNNHNNSDNSDNHHSDANSNNPCCNDAASKLESSLFNNIIEHQIVTTRYFLLGEFFFSTKVIFKYQSNIIVLHNYDDPPPLDGFGLRILIQSFLS